MAAPQTETNSGMPQWFQKFILWREHHVKEKNFVIFLSFVVGIFGGLAAMVLKWLIHTIGGFALLWPTPAAASIGSTSFARP